MLIRVTLYVSVCPPGQSAAPVAVLPLLKRGLESRTTPGWGLCTGRGAMLGAKGF